MRKTLVAVAIIAVLAVALPVSASQFFNVPFDRLVNSSKVIVRGTVGPVTSVWDADHEVIFSSADLQVSRFIKGDGPATLRIREVGGTVGDYTQQAIGFPVLREGESVVLMLTRWEDSEDYRIHAYRQGKYVVREDGEMGARILRDPVGQGEAGGELSAAAISDAAESMGMEEFESMVNAAVRGKRK